MKLAKIGFIVIFAAIWSFSCASAGGAAVERQVVEVYRWTFENPEAGTAGWGLAPEEYWDFNGSISLSRDDKTLGKPMLRVNVDFSADVESWWSEPKLKYDFDTPVQLTEVSSVVFDFYYNPYYSSKGSFKSKVIGFYESKSIIEAELDSIRADEEVGDYQKATVRLRFPRSSGAIDSLRLGIVGAVTDYNGPVFIDNLRME